MLCLSGFELYSRWVPLMYGNSFWRPMLPSLHRKSFDNEEKGKKIIKLSHDITMLKARPRGTLL